MGSSRQITESQLERAKAALAVRVKALQEKGLEPKAFKRDPHWRRLDARLRQINMRLRRIAEVETNNTEIEKLKGERIARVAAEKAERKATVHRRVPLDLVVVPIMTGDNVTSIGVHAGLWTSEAIRMPHEMPRIDYKASE